MFEVNQKAFQLWMVGGELQVPNFVFEIGVHVEEEEEKGQDCEVWSRINQSFKVFYLFSCLVVEVFVLNADE